MTKEIDQIEVRELKFFEIEQMLESTEDTFDPEHTLIHFLCIDERIPIKAITLSTGLQPADLKEYLPSLAKQIVEKVKAKNPFLLATIKRLDLIVADQEELKEQEEEFPQHQESSLTVSGEQPVA